MGGIFGGGGGGSISIPASETVPVPDKSSTEVQNLADEQRKRIYGNSAGRANAMLTSGAGASTAGYSKAVRMLGSSGGY